MKKSNGDSFVVQLLSRVGLFATLWTKACQASVASLSFTISWSLLRLMSFELVMPSNHLILCCPLLLMPSILPSITYLHNFSRDCVLQVLFSCLKNKQRLYQSLSIFSVSFSPCFILFSAFL